MKEATGELNTSIVIVLAVGILMAFFYYTVWPILKVNLNKNSQCSKAICEKCNDAAGCKTVTCHSKDNSSETFECVYKG